MRESIKEAVGCAVKNLVKRGIKTSFTKNELKELGVEIPEVMTQTAIERPIGIKRIGIKRND